MTETSTLAVHPVMGSLSLQHLVTPLQVVFGFRSFHEWARTFFAFRAGRVSMSTDMFRVSVLVSFADGLFVRDSSSLLPSDGATLRDMKPGAGVLFCR